MHIFYIDVILIILNDILTKNIFQIKLGKKTKKIECFYIKGQRQNHRKISVPIPQNTTKE